jgi:hypothetical protein
VPALATQTDYELLIGPDPTPASDEARLAYMLEVASSVVVTVAPGLYPWLVWPLDDDGVPVDPGPIPQNATLVTCQVASNLMSDPAGASGTVTMERVGLAQTHFTSDWTLTSGLLPASWRLLLKPWRFPDMASISLVVPHPSEGLLGMMGDEWWWWNELPDSPLSAEVP